MKQNPQSGNNSPKRTSEIDWELVKILGQETVDLKRKIKEDHPYQSRKSETSQRPKFISRTIGGSPGFSALPLSRDSFGLAHNRRASLRGRRLKGKAKGVLGARGARGGLLARLSRFSRT